MPQTGRRDLSKFRQRVARVVARHLPAGSRLISMTSRSTGRFRFKGAFQLRVHYRRQSGRVETVIVHANIPSRDTQHEAKVADQIERRLTSSGRFNGVFQSARSFGILRDGPANLYQDVPGTSLQSLLKSDPSRAVTIAARTADWLAELYGLRLKLGRVRLLEEAEREIGYFTDNIARVEPTAVEAAWLVMRAAVQSQSKMIQQYQRYWRTIHGDMNLGNMIDGGRSFAMIDFGNSRVFDPASDAGNFLAQIDTLQWRGELSTAAAKKLQGAFMRRWKRIKGLGPNLTGRVSMHRAWWILQVCAYTCATEPRIGRRVLPKALQQAGQLLSTAGFAPAQALSTSPAEKLHATLNNPDSMTAFFRARFKEYFPDDRSLNLLILNHQPALSTTSYLMRYKLEVIDHHGHLRERIIRGNSVDPATVGFVRYVKRHARTFETLRAVELLHQQRYYFYEELAGQPLRSLSLTSRTFDAAIPKIAAALADFHNLPVATVRSISVRQDAKLLATAQQNIRRFGRGCLPEFRTVAIRLLAAERKHWNKLRTPVHNDFQASNILLTRRGVGIIDYTLSGLAHPAIDVANFMTHLGVMLYGHRSAQRIRQLQNSFLRAYLRRTSQTRRQVILHALPAFELRSAFDILSTTVVNLGPKDPNRAIYVDLLVEHIRALLPSIV